MALALPLALLAITSHPLSLEVDQPHPVSVDTATANVPPEYGAVSLFLFTAKRHGAAACVS